MLRKDIVWEREIDKESDWERVSERYREGQSYGRDRWNNGVIIPRSHTVEMPALIDLNKMPSMYLLLPLLPPPILFCPPLFFPLSPSSLSSSPVHGAHLLPSCPTHLLMFVCILSSMWRHHSTTDSYSIPSCALSCFNYPPHKHTDTHSGRRPVASTLNIQHVTRPLA